MTWRLRILFAVLLLPASPWLTPGCGGQALAHRNWAGNGMSVAPWWEGVTLYEIDPIDFQDSDGNGFGDLRGIASRLDYLSGLGVDAIVLTSMDLRAGGGRAGGQPFDSTYGSEEDFAGLVGEATRRKMRVLVDLPLSDTETELETLAKGRFWLSRGVAGLRLSGGDGELSAPQRANRVRALRRLCDGYAGQRVLIDGAGAGAPVARSRRDVAPEGAELLTAPEWMLAGGVAGLRGALRAGVEGRIAVLASDAANRTRSFDRLGEPAAKVLAAGLLAGRGVPMLLFGQEVGMATGADGVSGPMQWGGDQGFTAGVPWIDMGPNAATMNVAAEEEDADSLLSWYRKLGELRRTHGALRGGTMEMLTTGNADAVAWARRKDGETVVVVVNTSGRAMVVPVGVSGSLRVLASTFKVDGAVTGKGVALPGYGVLIVDVRRPAGLESSSPSKRR